MSRSTFTRLCALSAILAGALRAIASFIPETSPNVYLLYFAIDLFLLFGTTALFLVSVTGQKFVGLAGFALMFLALLVLVARDIGVAPAGTYAGAAAVFSFGLDLLAIQVLRTAKFQLGSPLAGYSRQFSGR